jgi:4-alpha-glucanotransferase
VPADPNHYWNYRMHHTLEHLMGEAAFSAEIKSMVVASGRR